jgi:hypothetical protein
MNLVAHKGILLIHDDAVEAKGISVALPGSFRVGWVRHCFEGIERRAQEGRGRAGIEGYQRATRGPRAHRMQEAIVHVSDVPSDLRHP